MSCNIVMYLSLSEKLKSVINADFYTAFPPPQDELKNNNSTVAEDIKIKYTAMNK